VTPPETVFPRRWHAIPVHHHPEPAAGQERVWLFLGMALTESMGIFALVVALLLRFV